MTLPSLTEAKKLFEKACLVTDENNLKDGLEIGRAHV